MKKGTTQDKFFVTGAHTLRLKRHEFSLLWGITEGEQSSALVSEAAGKCTA